MRNQKRVKENGASVRLRPVVDCGLGLLLPQHSLPTGLAQGDMFSSGNICGSESVELWEPCWLCERLAGWGGGVGFITRIFYCVMYKKNKITDFFFGRRSFIFN